MTNSAVTPLRMAARTTTYPARGAWTTARLWARWISDPNGAAATRTLAAGDQTAAAKHDAVAAAHHRRIMIRIMITCLTLMVVIVGWTYLTPIIQAGILAGLTITLGVIGAPAKPSTTAPTARRGISSTGVTEALSVAIPAVAKALKEDPGAIELRGPAHRDGPGWMATVDLPPGVTVEDVVRARERVASGLRVPLDRLHLSTGGHAGQCGIWVADKSPSEMPPVAWPLVNAETFSIFDPIPVGIDLKGKPVAIRLMWGSLIIGGIPQYGKTATLRLIQSAAAMDPTCTLAIFDMKGGGDSIALEPAASVMRAGDDPDDIAALTTVLEATQVHMKDTYQKLRALNQPKLTRDIARQLGVGPTLITIDECQLAFRDDRVRELVEDIVRRGPAAGIMVCLSTQRPMVDSIPSNIRDNTTARIALRVQTQQANDAILGSGSYSSGLDATRFTAADRGVGIVAAEGADGVVVKLAFLTTDAAAALAARHPRSRTDTLEAVPDESPDSVVTQLLKVWPAGRDRATCAELAALLGWEEAAEVTRALRPYGIESRVLRVDGKSARSVMRADLEAIPSPPATV